MAVGAFVYEAQTSEGQTLSGTIDASSTEQATTQLQHLHLRIIRLEQSVKPPTPKPFRGEDFLAFNQQLAQLTAAGIPLERGLRLIASDIGSKRQAAAIHRIAEELEKGTPFEKAFAGQKGSFPPIYGKLLEAGVRAGNLSGMLLSVGRHAEMIQRLRAAVWRAASYPLMVLVALLVIMGFIWGWIIPHMPGLAGAKQDYDVFGWIRSGWGTASPSHETAWFLSNSDLMPIAAAVSYLVMALIALTLLSVAALWLLGRTRGGSRIVERLVLRLPLMGPVLKWNLLARWCDGLLLGLQAGLDLPNSLEIANGTVDSNRLRADSAQMIQKIQAGQAMDSEPRYRFLPAIVATSLQLGSEKNDLPETVATLAKMYQEQAEARLNVMPAALGPLLLLMITGCVGMAVVAALLPLVRMLNSFMPAP